MNSDLMDECEKMVGNGEIKRGYSRRGQGGGKNKRDQLFEEEEGNG